MTPTPLRFSTLDPLHVALPVASYLMQTETDKRSFPASTHVLRFILPRNDSRDCRHKGQNHQATSDILLPTNYGWLPGRSGPCHEMMVWYYCRQWLKQFIRSKPIRFGYKFWTLYDISGWCYNFYLYYGKEATLWNESLGTKVITNMLSVVDDP